MKINVVRQLGNLDCSSACLTMLLNYYGMRCSISEISAQLNVGRDGVSLRKIKGFCESIGFEFKAMHAAYMLNDAVIPFMAISNKKHYVVVEKIKKNIIYIIDPEQGRIKKTKYDYQKEYSDIIITIFPLKTVEKKNRNFTKVIEYKFSKVQIAIVLLCMGLGQVSMLCLPIITQKIIDAIYQDSALNTSSVLFAIVCVGVIYYLSTFIRKRVVLIMQNNMQKDVAKQLIEKLFKINLRFYESHSTGDIVNRINSINTINDFLVRTVLSLFFSLVTASVCFGVMLNRSSVLTLFIVLLAITQAVIIYVLNKRIKEKTNAYVFTQNRVQSEIFEVLSNLLQVKSIGLSDALNEDVMKNYDEQLFTYKEKAKASDLLDCILGTISIVTTTVIYFAGFYLVKYKLMSIGELVAYVTLVGYFINPIGQLGLILPQINMINETVNRIKEIMLVNSNKESGNERIDQIDSIILKDVSYSYNDEKKGGIARISLNISKGNKIAIVGYSGSGKTTLIKLIMNVVSDFKGDIYINDIPIRNISQEVLFDKISVVTQTSFILNNTIRRNIDILSEKSDLEIQEVLKKANLWEDIQTFPLGLNTVVGENGQNISGGQKQRIAIARALIKKPEVVIFDEASSNLDPITEKNIYDNIKTMQLTQIIITHRMASIKDADYIYVMQNGEIVESGTDEELRALGKIYYQMCTI